MGWPEQHLAALIQLNKRPMAGHDSFLSRPHETRDLYGQCRHNFHLSGGRLRLAVAVE